MKDPKKVRESASKLFPLEVMQLQCGRGGTEIIQLLSFALMKMLT